ncbi:MAG: hypothetical protein IJ462_01475 [Clostridia bacterium]|nr:hypothetical protein [Clostridia bacterium]
MKKIIALALAVIMLLALVACGTETFKCEICNKEKESSVNEVELMGKTYKACDDCYKGIDEGFDALGDAFDL